jgi:hypothetical protein
MKHMVHEVHDCCAIYAALLAEKVVKIKFPVASLLIKPKEVDWRTTQLMDTYAVVNFMSTQV